MNVTKYSEEEIKSIFLDQSNLKEVLAKIYLECGARGEVICEVSVNGIILTEEDERKFENSPISEIRNIMIRSQYPHFLLDESLEGCLDLISKLLGAFELTAKYFRSSNLHLAHSHQSACIEGVQWFIQMMTHFKAVYGVLRSALPQRWAELENNMGIVLNEIFDAYSKKNYILVADLLEYDLIGIFSQWHYELSQLERGAKGERSADPEIST